MVSQAYPDLQLELNARNFQLNLIYLKFSENMIIEGFGVKAE